jgi:hypothetical protein
VVTAFTLPERPEGALPAEGKRNSSRVHRFKCQPAMRMRVRIAAARCARALRHIRPSHHAEGAGKTGCALHPRSRVQSAEKKAHTSIQVQRRQSGLPCAVVYGLLRALPGDRLSCHRHFVRTYPTKLCASTGAPGPHDFAVREKPRSSVVTFASTASHRAFVTCARPSHRVRRAES